MHGGSNHFVVPTSLLHQRRQTPVALRRARRRRPRRGDELDVYLQQVFPSETTALIASGAIALLRATGHVGRQFAPTVFRILGVTIRTHVPPDDPFVRFTVPAFEMRRVLGELRAPREAFAWITCGSEASATRPGASATRATCACGSRKRRRRAMMMVLGGSSPARIAPATSSRVRRTSSPSCRRRRRGSWLALKTLLYDAYPVLDGLDELPCMDSRVWEGRGAVFRYPTSLGRLGHVGYVYGRGLE
mmetsp:Transcript_16727/g.67477  ORF Transcript_16727/g.67477 Transcript_16727/m.67477 type:complete len:247 (+) Transcript_16727:1106-1846(+)